MPKPFTYTIYLFCAYVCGFAVNEFFIQPFQAVFALVAFIGCAFFAFYLAHPKEEK